jgi:uncharacterized repeat protein (TIGR01451 family)
MPVRPRRRCGVAILVVAGALTLARFPAVEAQSTTWHRGLSAAEVNDLVQQQNLRVVNLLVDTSSGRALFDVAVVPDTGGRPWSWSSDVTLARGLALMQASPRRPVVVRAYWLSPGDLRFAVLWEPDAKPATTVGVASSHDITSRVAALLAVTDGTQGLYLKEVGGAVLAQQNANFPFEPASTIKAAPALEAMRQVEAGVWAFGNNVNVYQPPASGSCPTNIVTGTETLANAMREMLWHSDNQRTRVLVDTFGQANINTMMTTIGMAASSINHVIGCGGPPENQLTLADAGALYEGVATGTHISSANVDLFRAFFAGRGQFMVEGYDWTGIWDTDIPNMITAEAPAAMTTSQRQFLRNLMDVAYKAGNYKICVNNDCSDYRDHISISGWAEVPFCSATTIDPREYVFGVFIYNSTSDATSGQAFTSAKGELLREQIRDGMASCFHAELSLTSAASPSPVLSGSNISVTLNAANEGPLEAASVQVTGSTPAGTTFVSAASPAGWSANTPAPNGTGPIAFARNPMAAASNAQFNVNLNVACAVPDGAAIAFPSQIASASTPDQNLADNTATATVLVSNPAPVIGAVSTSHSVLWPPNHKMVDVTVNYTVADNCGTPACSLAVTSSEPDNGLGDGDTSGDFEIIDEHHVVLRAERSGRGGGRTYTVTVTCQDSGGGTSTTQTAVLVPHHQF